MYIGTKNDLFYDIFIIKIDPKIGLHIGYWIGLDIELLVCSGVSSGVADFAYVADIADIAYVAYVAYVDYVVFVVGDVFLYCWWWFC